MPRTMMIAGKEYPLEEKFRVDLFDQYVGIPGQIELRTYVMQSETVRARPYWDSNIVFPDAFDWRWMNRRGTLTKRLASFLHKDAGIKVNDKEQSEIGTRARQHARPASTLWLDITDDFNWHPGQYGDSGSCYWGVRRASRVILEAIEGYAIRGYEQIAPDTFAAKSRAWFYRHHEYENHWIVMNGYGWPTDTFAAAIAALCQTEYHPIDLHATYDNNLIFINKNRGFLVGDRDDMVVRYPFPDLRETNNCICGRIKLMFNLMCRKCQREADEKQKQQQIALPLPEDVPAVREA